MSTSYHFTGCKNLLNPRVAFHHPQVISVKYKVLEYADKDAMEKDMNLLAIDSWKVVTVMPVNGFTVVYCR